MIKRNCIHCGVEFKIEGKRPSKCVRKTCSPACHKAILIKSSTGRTQSPETIAKRKSSIKAFRAANPEAEVMRKARAAEKLALWRSDPANAAAISKRSSDHMKRLHADPDFQERRNARSSQTMKRMWLLRREHMLDLVMQNHARMLATETGICGTDSVARKNAASKWIMTKAMEALHIETDYDAVFAAELDRLRREMPYDGPQDGSDYQDYCSKIGTAVTKSPACRGIADPFMSEAIPRFSKEWQARK